MSVDANGGNRAALKMVTILNSIAILTARVGGFVFRIQCCAVVCVIVWQRSAATACLVVVHLML